MDNDQNLATQDAIIDGSQVDNAAGGTTTDDGSSTQPFLAINERTTYKTADEAKAGFLEAQKTITTLSGMRAAVEEYVGKGNASPELIKQLLAEVVEARKAKAEAEKSKKNTSSADAEDPRFEGKSADEIKAIKAADKWYKEQAEKHGFVSKDQVEQLKAEIEALKGAPEKQYEAANDAAVRSGREWLNSQLLASKITLTDAESKKLTARIAAYVDGDEELVGRWQSAVQSGNRAEREAIIKEAAEFALPSVKPGAKLGAPTVTTAKTKAQLTQRTAKNLPQPGAGNNNQGNGANNPKFSGLKDPKLTKAAMDRIDELMAEV